MLYWRDLAPGKKIEVNLDLICPRARRISRPGQPGYLYYNADHKHWVNPIEVVIEAGAAD